MIESDSKKLMARHIIHRLAVTEQELFRLGDLDAAAHCAAAADAMNERRRRPDTAEEALHSHLEMIESSSKAIEELEREERVVPERASDLNCTDCGGVWFSYQLSEGKCPTCEVIRLKAKLDEVSLRHTLASDTEVATLQSDLRDVLDMLQREFVHTNPGLPIPDFAMMARAKRVARDTCASKTSTCGPCPSI